MVYWIMKGQLQLVYVQTSSDTAERTCFTKVLSYEAKDKLKLVTVL